MNIFIHLIDGGTVEFTEDFTQEQIEIFFNSILTNDWLHYVSPNGKNHIIPKDKIKYIETKFKSKEK